VARDASGHDRFALWGIWGTRALSIMSRRAPSDHIQPSDCAADPHQRTFVHHRFPLLPVGRRGHVGHFGAKEVVSTNGSPGSRNDDHTLTQYVPGWTSSVTRLCGPGPAIQSHVHPSESVTSMSGG
jgi:hypothetical protein